MGNRGIVFCVIPLLLYGYQKGADAGVVFRETGAAHKDAAYLSGSAAMVIAYTQDWERNVLSATPEGVSGVLSFGEGNRPGPDGKLLEISGGRLMGGDGNRFRPQQPYQAIAAIYRPYSIAA